MKQTDEPVDYGFCAGHDFFGHMACPGCGEKILLRHVLDVLGPETIIVCPAGCAAVTDGIFPHSISPVPFLHVPFDATASAAAGVRAGLDMSGREDVTVLAWAGDGATFDIGMGALSAVAERNENILYGCYDNEAYMNTGIQRSSATPYGSWTTTTPAGRLKSEPKKNIGFIMAAHNIPYFATGSPTLSKRPTDAVTRHASSSRRLRNCCPGASPSAKTAAKPRSAGLCCDLSRTGRSCSSTRTTGKKRTP